MQIKIYEKEKLSIYLYSIWSGGKQVYVYHSLVYKIYNRYGPCKNTYIAPTFHFIHNVFL